MKTIKATTKPNGTTRMIIELAPGEQLNSCPKGQTMVTIDPDKYYKLGEPMRHDVFAGHILAEARSTYWCSLGQEWVD